MTFDYESAFEKRELEGYERLVHDAMLGDQTLFTRGNGIERRGPSPRRCSRIPEARALRARGVGADVDGRADRLTAGICPGAQRPLMSDRAWQVVVTTVVGLALLLVIRVVLGWSFDRYVERVARAGRRLRGRLHTRLVVLRHVIVATCSSSCSGASRDLPDDEQIARKPLHIGHPWHLCSASPSACRWGTSAPASPRPEPSRPYRRPDHRGRRDRHGRRDHAPSTR